MSRYLLRKAGGSVTVTVPPAFLKHNGLSAGSAVEVDDRGETLVITPAKTRLTMAEILRAAPKDVRTQRVAGWDELPPAGNEFN